MTLPQGATIGKYLVRRKLAEGGMAEIYLCAVTGPEGFEKEVVIKRIKPFFSNEPGFVQMFIEEARLASQLNHANIVQIFDFDKHDDTFFLAMEYVHGHSLWDIRRRSQELMMPMGPVMTAHILREVARGLHFAHELVIAGEKVGLVHRDVTPHNILVSYDGSVKLTDFGIAKGQSKLTVPGMLKGKFAYMSPEQSRGEDVDARTDIFALGIVLWEMLTGARLFDGETDLAVVKSVQMTAIAPPSRINPDVPAALDALVLRALERDRRARFQTALEFERALAQFVLTHAHSVDETDVRVYLQRLYATQQQGAHSSRSAEQLSATSSPNPSKSTLRLPDNEDFSAPTNVVPRERAPSKPPPAALPTADGRPRSQTLPLAKKTAQSAHLKKSPFLLWGLVLVAVVAVGLVALAVASRKPSTREFANGPTPSVPDASFQAQALSIEKDAEVVSPLLPEDAGVAVAAVAPEDAGSLPTTGDDAGVEAAQEAPRAIRSKTPSATFAKKLVRRGKGTLTVRAVPYAELFIDDKFHGEVETSMQDIVLSAGPHKLFFKHPSRVLRKTVYIRPDQQVVIEFSARR